MWSIIFDILDSGRVFSSRNTSSPGKGLEMRNFSWTAYQTVLPVSVFCFGKHTKQVLTQTSSGGPVAW